MRVLPLFGSLLSLAVAHVAGSPTQQLVRDADSDLYLRGLHIDRAAGSASFYGRNLRILPLGASITFGYHSTDGNGYRQHLKDLLIGANVTYIGSQCSGGMKNGNNEGHPGFVIGDMLRVAAPDLPLNPNVVLLYVGTNDMLYPVDPANAPQRMANLVSGLAAKLPKGTLIIVGNLFIETDPVVQKRIDTFNAALPGALQPLYNQGINVGIADMSKALTKQDLFCDGEHPIDSGYSKMADVFFGRLLRAAINRRIPNPSTPTGTDVKCTPLAPTPIGTCSSTKSSTSTTSSTPTSSPYPTTTNPPTTTGTASTSTSTTSTTSV